MSSFYGGRPGQPFIIMATFNSVNAMITQFKKGPNYTTVHYDENVVITTTDNSDDTNGNVYRRGYDYTNAMGGAELIGNIFSGMDMSSNAELADIRVGYDNTIYNSAGDAVRRQVKNANSAFENLTGDIRNIFDPSVEARQGCKSPTEALDAETLIPSTTQTGTASYSLIMKAIPIISGKTYAFPSTFVGRLTIFRKNATNNYYPVRRYIDNNAMTAGNNCLLWTSDDSEGYFAIHIFKAGGVTQTDLNNFMIIKVDNPKTFIYPDNYIKYGTYVPVEKIGNYDVIGKDAENAKAISAMNTASSGDVGKSLIVKTVSNGKVTEWEFGDAGGSIIDDNSGDGVVNKVWSANKTYNAISSIRDILINGGILETETTRNVDFSDASNGYINTSGSLVGTTASTYVHSAPFSLKAGEKINIKARGYNNSDVVLAILAKVVTNNSYQAIVNSIEGTTTAEDYTYTATEDCTVVISYRADTTHTAVIHSTNSIDILQHITNKPHFVKRQNDSVFIKSFYSNTEDIVVEIALAGGNGLPNPKNIFTVEKTSENMDSDITPSRYLLNRYTDWFSPHQVAAKENADGTAPTAQIFTGGNHQSNNSSSGGVATAECTRFDVLCDGVLVENGDSTFCETVAINITNLICGYNTWKSDGTGRKILKEQIRISMGASAKMQCEIIHTALEAVSRARYYGLQTVNDKYATVQYLGGTNRGEYAIDQAHNSGNKMCRDGRFQNSTGDIMLTHIDGIDLGSFNNSPATDYSYFTTTAKKSYFSLINYQAGGFEQNTGEQTCVCGWYDWVFNQ